MITFVDRLKCSEPHRYGTAGGLVPDTRWLIRAAPAAAAMWAKRYRPEGRDFEELGQFRLSIASAVPCADAWTVHADFVSIDGGHRGGLVEGALPGVPFGRRGDKGREAIGSLTFYGGVSTSRQLSYEPALDLFRDGWLGMAFRFDFPASIWLPGLGRGLIVVHVLTSAQGNYAWDSNERALRGQTIAPEYSVSLPITVLRGLPLFNVVGLGYSYDRVEHIAPGTRLERHLAGLSSSWFAKHLDMTLSWGLEVIEGHRAYRAFGVSIKPALCSFCERAF